MEIKIAHIADIHIGSPCVGAGNQSELRRFEIKDTFFKILNTCLKEKIDVLLIAGDLFDDVNLSSADIRDVKEALAKVDFSVVISPGNHDPFTSDSPYNSEWSDNVFIFKNNFMQCITLPKLNTKVWGVAFTSVYERNNLLKNVSVEDNNSINLCVMHGNISSTDNDMYCPIRLSDIENSYMDYIALGHIHKRSEILHLGNTSYAYSGCPEGTGFDELGDKGFYIGTVDKGRCNLKFAKVCKRTYESIIVDVSNASTETQIMNLIMEKVRNQYGENHSRNLYKITLCGFVCEDIFIDIPKLETILCEKLFFVKIIDSTETEVNVDKLKFRNDFKSIFIKKMILKIRNSKFDYEKEINKKALKLGLKAFSGEVKYYDN